MSECHFQFGIFLKSHIGTSSLQKKTQPGSHSKVTTDGGGSPAGGACCDGLDSLFEEIVGELAQQVGESHFHCKGAYSWIAAAKHPFGIHLQTHSAVRFYTYDRRGNCNRRSLWRDDPFEVEVQ